MKNYLQEKPDVIGLNAYTKDIHYVKILMSKIKPLLKSTKIVLGGVQMSLMPRETFECLDGFIDYGFAGESEMAFSKFVDIVSESELGESLNKVPNLV